MYLVGSAILPHPHIDSETYFVGQVGNGCDQCNDPGIYVMERRYDYVSGEWEYISSLTSAETLESAGVNGLDWGSSGMSGHMGKLYAGGMGIWEGGVTW